MEAQIAVNSEIVYVAAFRCKQNIYRKRMKALRQAAKSELAKIPLSARLGQFFGRKYTPKQPTRQEFLEKIRELWGREGQFGKLDYWHIGWQGDLRMCEELLAASKVPGVQVMFITSEAAELLQNYW